MVCNEGEVLVDEGLSRVGQDGEGRDGRSDGRESRNEVGGGVRVRGLELEILERCEGGEVEEGRKHIAVPHEAQLTKGRSGGAGEASEILDRMDRVDAKRLESEVV